MQFIRDIWLDMKGILRLARQMINTGLEPLSLSGAEGDILFHLLTGSNSFAQEQLAQQLDIGKAAISRVVDSLESKGYVKRLRQQGDKRAYNVCLTEKALGIGADVVGVYDRLYQLVSKGISDDDFRQVQSLLSSVCANLETMEEP